MDKRVKRCTTICGENTSGCFMTNKKHLECITDIVINRVWAAREIIDQGISENDSHHAASLLSMAKDELDELVYWMQGLRTTKKAV